MLEYFLQRCRKGCAKKKSLQRVDLLLHIKHKLRWCLNYQTPFYADYILKYRKNCHKIYFSVDNYCNFKATSKSDIAKQKYKEAK